MARSRFEFKKNKNSFMFLGFAIMLTVVFLINRSRENFEENQAVTMDPSPTDLGQGGEKPVLDESRALGEGSTVPPLTGLINDWLNRDRLNNVIRTLLASIEVLEKRMKALEKRMEALEKGTSLTTFTPTYNMNNTESQPPPVS